MTSYQKLINYKIVDRIENYNLYVDHVNMLGCLKILNFKIQNIRAQNKILGLY